MIGGIKLEAIGGSNFCGYDSFRLDIPSTGIALLTGANNAGKSSLLNALAFIAGLPGPALPRKIDSTDPCTITARFDISNSAGRMILKTHKQRDALLNNGALQWIDWKWTEVLGVLQCGEIRAAWNNNDELTLAAIDFSQNSMSLNDALRDDADFSNSSLSTVRTGQVTPLDDPHSASYLGAPSALFDYFNSWRQSVYHSGPLRQGAPRSANNTAEVRLNPDGSNIAAVLRHLQDNKPDLFAKASELLVEPKRVV